MPLTSPNFRHLGWRESAFSFGPFRLFTTQRLLTKDDRPVRIGSRAFDVLSVLVRRAGELVLKEELMAQVWPNTVVEPINLAVQLTNLRRALGDARFSRRYVVNIRGLGYRFVAPVAAGADVRSVEPATEAPTRVHNLPTRLMGPIGRSVPVDQLAARTAQERLLMPVGTGGVGMSIVAPAIAERAKSRIIDT